MPNFLSVSEIEDHLELLMYLPCANDDAYPAALRQAGFQISSGYDAHLDEEEGRQRVTVSIMHVGDESGVAARSENTTMISGGSPRSLAGNLDSPQAGVFLTSIIDGIVGVATYYMHHHAI